MGFLGRGIGFLVGLRFVCGALGVKVRMVTGWDLRFWVEVLGLGVKGS